MLDQDSKLNMHLVSLNIIKDYSWNQIAKLFIKAIEEGLSRTDLLDKKVLHI